MRRRLLTAASAVVFLAVLVPRAQASGVGEIERWLIAERSAHGLNGLSSCPDLQSYAAARAVQQAAALRIWHADDLTSAVGGWLVIGEIVGRGTSVAAVNHAWSQSPPHVEKYLEPRFTEVGVGTAMGSDGWVYAAVVLRQPSAPCPGARFLGGSSPAAPPAPAAAQPAPAPAPVAAPAPAIPRAPAPSLDEPALVPVAAAAAGAPEPGSPADQVLSPTMAASLEVTRSVDASLP